MKQFAASASATVSRHASELVMEAQHAPQAAPAKSAHKGVMRWPSQSHSTKAEPHVSNYSAEQHWTALGNEGL